MMNELNRVVAVDYRAVSVAGVDAALQSYDAINPWAEAAAPAAAAPAARASLAKEN